MPDSPVDRARRRPAAWAWPAWTALGAAAVLGTSALVATYGPHVRADATVANVVDGVTTLLPVPVAFVLGAYLPRWTGLLAVAWMAVAAELTQGYVNPFVLVITFGPWLVGAMIRDRRQLAAQLVQTGLELEAETRRLTEESVRYERARIAHELHDIVAHCVSVMVVQAYAGERLATRDQGRAVTAFDHISDAARQAQFEIGHLVELLASEPPSDTNVGLSAGVADLVAGAVATGLSVNLSVRGDADRLPSAVSRAAYRIIQECITNALKHAPGARIDIKVNCSPADVRIDVANAITSTPAPLHLTGGGHGLAGMRDRVGSLQGTFAAGLEEDGQWHVSARLPLIDGSR